MTRRRGTSYLRELRETLRFRALPEGARSIVFYAEDAASWVHFEPIVRHLTGPLGLEICYLTSSPDDPILEREDAGIRAFCVGQRILRTWLFMDLKADVMVMTMPDLETFQVKRSRTHPVHYVYVFHSMMSSHMIYRQGAFDHYDTVLAVGPHHLREIRATEKAYGLPAKHLVEHGYGRLDTILAARGAHGDKKAAEGEAETRVLIAPSWAPEGLLEGWGVELVEILLAGGYHVTVRPHPMTFKKWPQVRRDLEKLRDRPRYVLETDVASQESLHRSDIMISDWSGAALEYAFGLERPVLFVDVLKKVRNPEYEKIDCDPLEVTIRDRIGEVVAPEDLDRIGDSIDRLCADPAAFRERLREAREGSVYNVARSGAVGAEAIARLAREKAAAESTPGD